MASYKYVQRKYREGKVVAYMRKNGSVMRYKLCKIDKKWLTTTLQVKSDYPLRNAEELNKEIICISQTFLYIIRAEICYSANT